MFPSHPPNGVPRLLVSVRSPSEASVAIAAGIDLLDIKEPQSGSLGMAAPRTIRAILESVSTAHPIPGMSVALGELLEWRDPLPTGALDAVQYVKFGLSRTAKCRDWQDRWDSVIESLRSGGPGRLFQTVAVAYVDREFAQSPPPEAIIDFAQGRNCAGVLFDTYMKNGQTFLDWMDGPTLERHLDDIHEAGMFCAVAGSLRCEDLAQLRDFPIDIVAVRTAACESERRDGTLSADAIRRLQQVLHGTERPVGT